MVNTPSLRPLAALALLSVAGCGREVTPTGHRFAGVGLNPEEIGPSPELYNGLVAYDFMDFAGGGLPLALAGLVAYDEVSGGDFKAPFELVMGSAYFIDQPLPETDVLFGNWGVPPKAKGKCHTNYDPRSYLGGIADAGNEVRLEAVDGSASYSIGRRPLQYGPDMQRVFPAYLELGSYRGDTLTGYAPSVDENGVATVGEEVLLTPNYAHGKVMNISFPGAISELEADFGAIPVPLASEGTKRSIFLPNRNKGLMLSWNGALYDPDGSQTDSGGEFSTCMKYTAAILDEDTLADEGWVMTPEFCAEDDSYAAEPNEVVPQIYTGPWDTQDGVTFDWVPADNTGSTINETVSISVRFLGPLDRDDQYKVENIVDVPASDYIADEWAKAQDRENIPADASLPDGRRAATTCDDDAKWVFDDGYLNADGSPILALQGEPNHTLAEVSCNVDDAAGTFTITNEMVADAMAYAERYGAEGAIFYMTRSTELDMNIPDIRDRYGFRVETDTAKVKASAATIGRFYWNR